MSRGFYFQCLFALFITVELFRLAAGDVGAAAHYTAPFLPTACFGSDASQIPKSGMFAAAGEGIWDNEASCGRLYQVRCLSSSRPRTCLPGEPILIKIVDRALTAASMPSRANASLVLSSTAFSAIADASASFVNVEFQQV